MSIATAHNFLEDKDTTLEVTVQAQPASLARERLAATVVATLLVPTTLTSPTRYVRLITQWRQVHSLTYDSWTPELMTMLEAILLNMDPAPLDIQPTRGNTDMPQFMMLQLMAMVIRVLDLVPLVGMALQPLRVHLGQQALTTATS